VRKERETPYPKEMFSSEKWRRYWIGKTKRIKNGVTEYLSKYRTKDEIPLIKISKKNNVTQTAMLRHIKILKDLGIIENIRHQVNLTRNAVCVECENYYEKIHGIKKRRICMFWSEKSKSSMTRGQAIYLRLCENFHLKEKIEDA